MKIIPDGMYANVQCGATRVTDGSRRVIPVVADTIPIHLLGRKIRWIVIPSIVLFPLVASFCEPLLMFPMSMIWVTASWVLGECFHCRDLNEGEFEPESVEIETGLP